MNSSEVTRTTSNTSQLMLLESAYILPGSVITLSPVGSATLVVVQLTDMTQNVTVCSEHTCTINQTGYYSVFVTAPPINTTIAYQLSIKSINATYYNITSSSFLQCTLDKFSYMCRFELDDLTEYHLLAILNASQSVDSAIELTACGGTAHLVLCLVLLTLPLITTVVALLTVITVSGL